MLRRSCARCLSLGSVGDMLARATMRSDQRAQLDAEAEQSETDVFDAALKERTRAPNERGGGAPRSVLFVPCSNAKALKKAATLDVDALILDLEDSVPLARKAEAREALRDAVEHLVANARCKRLVVRVNSPREAPRLGVPDMQLVGALGARVEAVAIPKTTKDDYAMVKSLLHPQQRLWAFFETPRSVLDADAICAQGVYEFAVMGTNDLSAELALPLAPGGGVGSGGRWPLHFALSRVVMAARANGVVPLDGVFNDPLDHAGFEAECAEGRRLGFAGKTLIHPSQIAPCNAAFSPTPAECEWAARVIDAVRRSDGGVATVDGKMVEELHAKQALLILARQNVGARANENNGGNDKRHDEPRDSASSTLGSAESEYEVTTPKKQF